jgi:hypothetical protein
MIPTAGFAVGAFLVCRWLPDSGNVYMDLFFNGSLFCIMYGVTIWKLEISPDINHWVGLAITRLKAMYPRASKS